jgi:hypothetical protein
MERAAAVGGDANTVALKAVAAGAVALEDGNVDALFDEPVGQAESAGARADNDHLMTRSRHGWLEIHPTHLT